MDIKSSVAEARNEYTYSASGQKLKVVQKWNSSYSTSPVVGSAVNTAALNMNKTTDYVGNKIYENNALKRILVDGGYIEGGVYYFYLTDHLGNNRVVANASGTAIQKTHYYPFGMAFAENTGKDKQPYKYNGKELDAMHGLNMYDYSARYYEPAVGRFSTVDPLAEMYYSISPYAYCGNNPIKFIDPTGMSYTYNWNNGQYQDADGNEVEWQTVKNYLLNGGPPKRGEKHSHFGLEKSIKENNIPSPVADFLHASYAWEIGSLDPVAFTSTIEWDAEIIPVSLGLGLGGGLILKGADQGQVFFTANSGLGAGVVGATSIGVNQTVYFYTGDHNLFERSSLNV